MKGRPSILSGTPLCPGDQPPSPWTGPLPFHFNEVTPMLAFLKALFLLAAPIIVEELHRLATLWLSGIQKTAQAPTVPPPLNEAK